MWSRFRNRLRFLFRRDRFDIELSEEMELHRRLLERDKTREGLDPEGAARAARQQFGNTLVARDDARDAWRFAWLEALVADARYGLRSIRKSPGFAVVAIVSLALGTGANTAIFSLINAVMLTSLPVSRPDELVLLAQRGGPSKGSVTFSPALWLRIQEHQDVFSSVAVYGATGSVDLGTGDQRRATVGLVSGGFFSTLGVRPAIGRTLVGADDYPRCPPVAVITHAFWQGALGTRGDILDQSISLNGRPFEIVGVTAPEFFGIEHGTNVPVWVPQCAATSFLGAGTNPGGGWVIGRLRPDVSISQSRARMAALASQIFQAAKNIGQPVAGSTARTIDVVPFAKGLPFLQDRYGEALFILMATVAVVLLVACANIANMMLARTTACQRDINVRLALGASRARIVQQLLIESSLLAFAGAALGIAIAYWGGRGLVAMLSDSIVLDLTPDVRVLAFTVALAILTALAFGLIPAWRAARYDREGSRGSGGAPRVMASRRVGLLTGGRGVIEGQSRFGLGQVLVGAQIALSLVMVVSALLLVGSWSRLLMIDTGFRAEGVLLGAVGTGSTGLAPDQQAETFTRVLDRLRSLPGVSSAAAVWIAPLGQNARMVLNAEGFTTLPAIDLESRLNHVSEGYFRTIGTPLLAGRDFGPGETVTSPAVAIVNEELARRLYGRVDVVHQRFRVRRRDGLGEPVEIIGVVANTTWGSLREERQPIVYNALTQNAEPGRAMNFVMRTDGQVRGLDPGVKAAVADVNPRLTLTLTSLQQRVHDSVRLPRTLAALSGFFGGFALLLAMIGLYGVVSYTVGRRRNEIGVRLAFGAMRSSIVGMVLGETARVVIAGVVLGTGLSMVATRLVSSFLYGVTPNNPTTLLLSAVVLVCVSFGAALIPAHRAARMNPVAALRED
ncbi:MAG TPA: ABC transporter permease [Vicinamibacterales bacterium]|nr:ABC transporter permease [Vicinamibacterales bacterium]